MTFVIVSGEIDLSVGSTYALASTVTGLLIEHGHSWILAVVAGLLRGRGLRALERPGDGRARTTQLHRHARDVERDPRIASATTTPRRSRSDQTVDNVSKFSYLGEGGRSASRCSS